MISEIDELYTHRSEEVAAYAKVLAADIRSFKAEVSQHW